jgi:hypothetical protein
MANGRGGARPGAGRKPKTLLYGPVARQVEARIDKLIDMAKEGDLAAAKYLCDRILGRVAALDTAPALDRHMPYTEEEFIHDAEIWHPHLLEDDEDDDDDDDGVDADAEPSTQAATGLAEPIARRSIGARAFGDSGTRADSAEFGKPCSQGWPDGS